MICSYTQRKLLIFSRHHGVFSLNKTGTCLFCSIIQQQTFTAGVNLRTISISFPPPPKKNNKLLRDKMFPVAFSVVCEACFLQKSSWNQPPPNLYVVLWSLCFPQRELFKSGHLLWHLPDDSSLQFTGCGKKHATHLSLQRCFRGEGL